MSSSDAAPAKEKQTRHERFLVEMEQVVMLALNGPFCSKAGNVRPPYPLETIFRIIPAVELVRRRCRCRFQFGTLRREYGGQCGRCPSDRPMLYGKENVVCADAR